MAARQRLADRTAAGRQSRAGGMPLRGLLQRQQGVVLLDGPGANPAAGALMGRLGFTPISDTPRMYRGAQPQICLADVYGLACLELG